MRREAPSADEDARLVALCKKGDLDAFEELVIRHQKTILNIAYRMLGNYEDACEITQDAFVSAYKSLRNFEERARFSTWLYAIVLNLSRNRLKQMKTRQYYEKRSIDDPAVAGGTSADPPAGDPSALEVLEKKDLQQQIQGCIDRLDGEFREVIVLRDIRCFSYEEISDMLGIPAGTVKSRISRARSALRECLRKVIGGS